MHAVALITRGGASNLLGEGGECYLRSMRRKQQYGLGLNSAWNTSTIQQAI
jgi:hypothetical protein